MNKGAYTAIIVEGASREMQVLENFVKINFKRAERYKIIHFPAEQNIYMLWKIMDKDNFETDVIEIVREYSEQARKILSDLSRKDFSDVFLFFDYDGHQNNLAKDKNGDKVLLQMLKTFDNETENGKLYISYPMVEAVRDFIPNKCNVFTSCICYLKNIVYYKNQSANGNPNIYIKNYTFQEWREIINVFVMRVSCLFNKNRVIKFEEYRGEISSLTIYEKQKEYIEKGQIFILSAFPEFLLDYYRKDFWNSNIKFSLFQIEKHISCIKNGK